MKSGTDVRDVNALAVVIVVAHADLDKVVAGVDAVLAVRDLDANMRPSADLLLAVGVNGELLVPGVEGVF